LGYEIKKIQPEQDPVPESTFTGAQQDTSNTQTGVNQDRIPGVEEVSVEKEVSLYGEDLQDIIKTFENNAAGDIALGLRDSARWDIYGFLEFCHGFIDVDIENSDEFFSFLGDETQAVYNYLKENNFPLRDDIALQSFFTKQGIAPGEYDLVMYLEWKISKYDMISLYEQIIEDLSVQQRWFHQLYMKALINKIQSTLFPSVCNNIVTESGIVLPQ